jgi:hypothetical protein
MTNGDFYDNLLRGCNAGLELIRAGIPCIVPHLSAFIGQRKRRGLYYAELLPGGTTSEDWYNMDLIIVSHCDALLRLPGFSVGADLEEAEARFRSIPVFTTINEVIAWADQYHANAAA